MLAHRDTCAVTLLYTHVHVYMDTCSTHIPRAHRGFAFSDHTVTLQDVIQISLIKSFLTLAELYQLCLIFFFSL